MYEHSNEIFRLVLLRFRESNCGKTIEADHNTGNLNPPAAYQFKPEGPVIADLRQRTKKKSRKSSQETLLHFTCNYRLDDALEGREAIQRNK